MTVYHTNETCELQMTLPKSYTLLTEFTVLGEPGRKSNSRRIVKSKTGKPLIIKSEKAMQYGEAFLRQVTGNCKGKWGSPTDPLALWVHVYYASNRPDLSIELIMDLLQKAEVISNDRFVKCQLAFGSVDKDNPRSVIRLYKIS